MSGNSIRHGRCEESHKNLSHHFTHEQIQSRYYEYQPKILLQNCEYITTVYQ